MKTLNNSCRYQHRLGRIINSVNPRGFTDLNSVTTIFGHGHFRQDGTLLRGSNGSSTIDAAQTIGALPHKKSPIKTAEVFIPAC